LDEARSAVQTALDGTVDADDVQFGALSLLSAARLRILDAEWDDARRLVAEALPLIERSDEHFYLSKAYRLGIEIEAGRVAANGPDPKAAEVTDDLLARLRAARQALLDRGVVLLPEPVAEFSTAEAQAARVRQQDDPAQWAELVATWERLGQPVRAAAARVRQADALLRRKGERSAVAELLRAAHATAQQVGAVPLAGEIDRLAARGRVDLDPDARRPLDVTPRELDVLRLLAQGRTNRQIGETLFISEKTASVHVTNLLRKLGVGSRVEAAALALRSGVADG
jgi:DNA-binding NarL/FixJ family response regulator